MKNIFVEVLLGVLAAAFLAWAGVVWSGVQAVKETQTIYIISIETRLGKIQSDLEHIKEKLDNHLTSVDHR